MQKVKKACIHLFLYGIIIAFLFAFYHCPFKVLTGLDCPGCGLTRAFRAALHFDFVAAFQYHPLFWLLGAEAIYYLFFKSILHKQFSNKVELTIACITIVLLLAVWLYKIIAFGGNLWQIQLCLMSRKTLI